MAGQFRYVGRVADGDGGDDPGDVADIVRTAAFRLLFRRLQLFELGGKAINLLGTHILLDELGESLFALGPFRSEEHTSELQSLMRISYAVFCLKKNKPHKT